MVGWETYLAGNAASGMRPVSFHFPVSEWELNGEGLKSTEQQVARYA